MMMVILMIMMIMIMGMMMVEVMVTVTDLNVGDTVGNDEAVPDATDTFSHGGHI